MITPRRSPLFHAVCWLFLLVLGLGSLHAETRIWTDRNGREIEAQYLRHDDETVTIRRIADDREFEFPIRVLSRKDQEWLAGRGVGIYIAVGNGAHRISSPDGITWSNHVFVGKPGHNQNDIKDIAVGNGVCIAVGGFSRSNIFVTRDGMNWEQNPFNIGVLSGVIFRDGQFYVFGEGGRVAVSEDGEDWEKVGEANFREHLTEEAEALGLDERLKSNIRSWAEANGTFVGAGDNGVLVVTRDFEEWIYPPRIEPHSRCFIESDANGFVVRGDRTLHHSPDGITWTEVTPEFDEDEQPRFVSIVHDGERFIVNTRDGEGWASKDGTAWERIESATFPGHLAALRPDLYYSFQTYWKYTEDLLRSTDGGETWESCKIPAPVGVTNLIFAEGLPAFSDSSQGE